MSIFSQQLLFSDQQVVTTTAFSTGFIDLGERSIEPATGNETKGDLGAGATIPLAVHVTEDFTATTGVHVELVQSDSLDTAGTALVSPEVVDRTAEVPVAELVAGYRFNMDSIRSKTTKRYIQLQYVCNGTAVTGKVTAGIVAANAAGTH